MDNATAQAISAIITAAAAVVAGGFLIWYTFETYRMRKATQLQAEKTAKLLQEAQKQNEEASLPLVVLEFHYRTHELAIRNVGTGPAFNIWINGVGKSRNETLSFNYPSTLAAGESQPVDMVLYSPLVTERELTPFPFVELVAWIWARDRPYKNEIHYWTSRQRLYATYFLFERSHPNSIVASYYRQADARIDIRLTTGAKATSPEEVRIFEEGLEPWGEDLSDLP